MKITVLIPSKNEAKSIERCVQSVLNQTRKVNQVVVVDDASTDRTLKILQKYKKKIKVLVLSKSAGNKSHAQRIGMLHVTGDIVITTDADTVLHPDFVKHIIKEFDDKSVVAAAGHVKSLSHNWLTACRHIEYIINQSIHKKAQAYVNALYVIPGCAAAYKLSYFKKHISIDHDTLTEDLDFTYKYHKNNLKISYCSKAIAYTQDPSTLVDYITQIRRWHAGNWQNLMKHAKILEKPGNALQLSLIFIEGLVIPFVLILALIFNFALFATLYLSYVLAGLVAALYGYKQDKRIDGILVSPIFPLVNFINYAIFIEQFIEEVILNKNSMIWNQPKRRTIA